MCRYIRSSTCTISQHVRVRYVLCKCGLWSVVHHSSRAKYISRTPYYFIICAETASARPRTHGTESRTQKHRRCGFRFRMCDVGMSMCNFAPVRRSCTFALPGLPGSRGYTARGACERAARGPSRALQPKWLLVRSD